jgi:tetratricopeptide (TPR) repeat protein
LNSLGMLYARTGGFVNARDLLTRCASVGDTVQALDSLAETYYLWGKLDEAVAKYQEALEIQPGAQSYVQLAYIYALKEDYDRALSTIDRLPIEVKIPLRKWEAKLYKGFLFYWLGNIGKAEAEFREADRIDREEIAGQSQATVGTTSLFLGFMACERGDYERGRNELDHSLALFAKAFPERITVAEEDDALPRTLLDIRQSRVDPARIKIEGMDRALLEQSVVPPEMRANSENLASHLSSESLKIYVLDTSPLLPNQIAYKKSRIDRLKVELALSEGSAAAAVDLCKNMKMLWTPPLIYAYNTILHNLNVPRGLLARAYEKAGELSDAIAEYERVTSFDPKSPDRRLIDPLDHYRLGKLYEQAGRKNKARARYERFLALWKDADPGTPEVEDARKRLAALG